MKSSFIVATMDSALLHQFMVFLLFCVDIVVVVVVDALTEIAFTAHFLLIFIAITIYVHEYRVATAREIQIVFNRCLPLLKTHKYYVRDTTPNKIHICSHMSGG